MAHHGHHDEIVPPKRLELSQTFKMATGGLAAAGALIFAITLFAFDADVAWKGYLIGFWFTLSLALFGPFFASIQHLPRAGWSVSLRRIVESFGYFLPVAGVFALIGLFAIPDSIFLWKQADALNDPFIAKKAGFLNQTGFVLATVLSFASWIGVFAAMRKFSLKQDETGDYELSNKLKALSAIYLVIFTTGISFMAWYWMMSLEPNWFSTMFSVYTFAGLFQSGLAMTYVIMIYLGRKGYFGSFVGGRQVHDLGKMVFGFTVFYAYIGFCQFLLIWYANIPEEAVWYIQRFENGWLPFTLALPFIKFIIPFFIMLPQKIKKNKDNVMYYLCMWIFGTQLYEVWYWVEPQVHGINTGGHHGGGGAGFSLLNATLEFGIALGFVGLFAYVAGTALSRANIIPVKDPYLHETLPEFTHEPPLMGGVYDKSL